MRMSGLKKILFLCTSNSCRSQMAEGFAKALLPPEKFEAYSAGIESSRVNPKAVLVMKEAGVDISAQRSKSLEALEGVEFDLVVTVCGGAKERCPVFPGGAKTLHAPFDDPPALEAGAKDAEEALGHYRRVRDGIREFVLKLPEMMGRL
jgi:arsenate reductase